MLAWGKQEVIAIHYRRLRIQQGAKPERITVVLRNLVQNPRLTALIEPLLAGTAKSLTRGLRNSLIMRRILVGPVGLEPTTNRL